MSQSAILDSIEKRLSEIEKMLKDKLEIPVSAKELEEKLNISRMQHVRLRRNGILKAHKLGGKIYFLMSEVLQAMKEDQDSKK